MANQVLINIKTKLDSKAFRQMQTRAQKAGKAVRAAFSGLGTVAGAGIAAGFAAAIAIGKQSIELFQEQERVERQLDAVLKSTGNAAGITAAEVKSLAGELQGLTNFGDEATIAGANLLLTFKDIGAATFPRATASMLDMSAAMGTGLKESAIQLGKALNDPVAGLSALSRVGIQFTQQQKDQIKTLQDNNQLFEAQAIILDEIESQFGGSAEAAREADGGFKAAANAVGDLQEAIGGELIEDAKELNLLIVGISESLTEGVTKTGLLRSAFKDAAGVADMDLNANLSATEASLFLLSSPTEALSVALGRANRLIEDAITPAANALTQEFVEQTVGLDNMAVSLAKIADAEKVAATEAANAAKVGAKIRAQLRQEEQEAAAAEKAAEEAEKLLKQQEKFARDILKINEDATGEVDEIWDKFHQERLSAEAEFDKNIIGIQDRGAKDLARISEDGAKDLAKIAQKRIKDLAKINSTEQKDIRKAQKSFETSKRNETKRSNIDSLADQRLFDFEIRNLATEGQANRIRELQERRAIEQQIAKEKSVVESQIETEKQQSEISSIRETASERRNQLQIDAAADRAIKEQEIADDLALREDQLNEELAAETEALESLRAEQEIHREEKLQENEEARLASIATLGRELTEMQELTKSELGELAQIAGRLGEQAGAQFAEGMARGAETNQRVQDLLGVSRGTGRGGGTRGARRTTGQGGSARGFAQGGSFRVGGSGGTDSQLVAFKASPDETVTVSTPGQSGADMGMLTQMLAQVIQNVAAQTANGVVSEFQDVLVGALGE